MQDPRKPSASMLRFDDDNVTVLVGRQEAKFTVHRSHLQRTSAFFQAALKRQWKEGQDGTVKLPDDEPRLINMYLHFIYTGGLPCIHDATDVALDIKLNDAEYVTLSFLYVLGEKYQDSNLKNAVIDAIVAKSQAYTATGSRWYPADEAVDVLYRGTPAGSPGRLLMVELHVCYGFESWLHEAINNAEFTLDLSRRLMGLWQQCWGNMVVPPVPAIDASAYHNG